MVTVNISTWLMCNKQDTATLLWKQWCVTISTALAVLYCNI